MRFIISVVFFLSICTFAMGQGITKADTITVANKIDDWSKSRRLENYKWYSMTVSRGIIINNSYPKGGRYTDPNGKHFGYSIYFTRIINANDTPIELTISFPDAILPLPESYLKLFLPPDTMTVEKVVSYDYGADIKSFLDTGINSATMLQKTINPKEEFFFYVGAAIDHADAPDRAELILNEQGLFYRIIGIAPGLDLIPCGRIVFKK